MNEKIKRKKSKLNCKICETEFIPLNQVQLTCSKGCSRELNIRRARLHRENNKNSWTPKRKPCEVCGTIFLPTVKHGKYCSHECLRESIRSWKTRNYSPEQKRRQRDRYYFRKYGITIEQFEEMVKTQKGKCLICKNTDPELFVDHNHSTGKVRGLLCLACNTGLGSFKENKVLLQRVMKYLEKYNGK